VQTSISRLSRFGQAAALALGVTLALGSHDAAAQSDEDKAGARSLATQAMESLKANKYAEALDLVSRAEALVHAPTHLLIMARAQVGLGRFVAAKENYLKLQREELAPNAPPAFKKAQEDARTELPPIEPRIASLKIVLENAKDKKVTVKLDDVAVAPALIGVHRPVDPGKHEAVAYPVGLSPVKATVELKDGEKKEIKITLPEGPAPGGPVDPHEQPEVTPRPTATGSASAPPPPADSGSSGARTGIAIGAIGLGVVGGVLGGIFIAKKGSDATAADDLFNQCRPRCDVAQRGAINDKDNASATDGTIAVVGFIGAGVGIGVGVILLATGGSKKATAAKNRTVTPWFDGQRGGLAGTF
jgi:hypothetical protein